jgi:4-amino-4-deoxy-L-arabinose transferase-like glycosyltransferase
MPTQIAQLRTGSDAPWRAWWARFSPDAASITPLVLLLLLGHLLLWTALAAISHSAPDVDNMEELVWGNVFQLGYYKHPPFPSWALFALASVFGRPVWLTFLAGQLSVVIALWCVWRLGCEMTSQKNALVAVLVATLITYFNIHGIVFNHNTMQLCSIAACHWMFYRSWRDGRWRDWWMFGFCCGLAMLTKYSALIQFATYFLFLLMTGSLKRAPVWRGIALATATFALVFAPHAWWVSQQAMGPIHYASGSLNHAMTRPEQLHMFSELLATTLARLAPMGIGLILIAILMTYTGAGTSAPAAGGKLIDRLRPADRRFLVVIGLGPLVLTLLVAMAMKTRIVAPWTTTFYLLFGFIALWMFQNDASSRLLRTCIKVVILLQVVFALGYAAGRGPLSNMTGRATRATFPGHAVSLALQAQWDQHSRTPLGLVAADTWLGGNIAIYGGRRVDVLIDGDFGRAPWVTRQRAASCGMLIALNRSPNSTDGVPPNLVELMAMATVKGILQMPWTGKANGPQVVVEWGIVPPLSSCSAPR